MTRPTGLYLRPSERAYRCLRCGDGTGKRCARTCPPARVEDPTCVRGIAARAREIAFLGIPSDMYPVYMYGRPHKSTGGIGVRLHKDGDDHSWAEARVRALEDAPAALEDMP